MDSKKQYFTKTGIELKLIDGGLGQVESIGGDDLMDLVPEFDDYSRRLEMIFGNSSIILKQTNYIGFQCFELVVTFKIDSSQWTNSKNRHRLLGSLTIDLGNYLSRCHGLNEFVTPSVNLDYRSKNGQKTLVFTYQVSEATAYSMGMSQDGTMVSIQRGA